LFFGAFGSALRSTILVLFLLLDSRLLVLQLPVRGLLDEYGRRRGVGHGEGVVL
jgi:hypothetical protein